LRLHRRRDAAGEVEEVDRSCPSIGGVALILATGSYCAIPNPFQTQRIFGRDDCIYGAIRRIILATTFLLQKDANLNEVTKKPTRSFTRGPPYPKTNQSLN